MMRLTLFCFLSLFVQKGSSCFGYFNYMDSSGTQETDSLYEQTAYESEFDGGYEWTYQPTYPYYYTTQSTDVWGDEDHVVADEYGGTDEYGTDYNSYTDLTESDGLPCRGGDVNDQIECLKDVLNQQDDWLEDIKTEYNQAGKQHGLLACRAVNCDFSKGSFCQYRTGVSVRRKRDTSAVAELLAAIETPSKIHQLQPELKYALSRNPALLNRLRQSFLVERGDLLRTQQRVSWIRAAGFVTAQLEVGQAASLITDIYLEDMTKVFFRFYRSNSGRLSFCCDGRHSCPFQSDIEGNIGDWQYASTFCPRATSKMFFLCENWGHGPVACGVEFVRLEGNCEKPAVVEVREPAGPNLATLIEEQMNN